MGYFPYLFSICYRIAFLTQSFQPSLLAVNDNAFFQAFNYRNRHPDETLCQAALCTGEMGMALNFAAIMRKFKEPCPFLQKRLMHKTRIQKTFERSINCNLVEMIFREKFCQLILAKGFGLIYHCF